MSCRNISERATLTVLQGPKQERFVPREEHRTAFLGSRDDWNIRGAHGEGCPYLPSI